MEPGTSNFCKTCVGHASHGGDTSTPHLTVAYTAFTHLLIFQPVSSNAKSQRTCLQLSMVFSPGREEDLARWQRAVPCRAVPLTPLLLQAREQSALPGTGVILQRRSVATQMKFDHIRCWSKSWFGPADALLNPAKSFTGESPLLATSQHQLLLAFLWGNNCHEKEGKRIPFGFFFHGELKALKAMGLSHCTI